jgi:hypothetical protein
MTEETENLVLEILRGMRKDMTKLTEAVDDLKSRMTNVESTLGSIQASIGPFRFRSPARLPG